jgi:predicted nucleic acid-binding protein
MGAGAMASGRKDLPGRVAIDSGVLSRALDDMDPDADSPVCRSFWDSMLASSGEILIAAPTLAEVLRAKPGRVVPRTEGVEIVNFDQRAAEDLARLFPIEDLKVWADEEGVPRTYYKYDALIVACAFRHKSECMVTLDPHFKRLGKVVGLPVHHPSRFAAQPDLPFDVRPAPSRATVTVVASAPAPDSLVDITPLTPDEPTE